MKRAKIAEILEEIDAMLYEGLKPRHPATEKECKEWIRQFIFLRIVGHGIPMTREEKSANGAKKSKLKNKKR
ncbi:unnamed protein product [Soboliphyme baturini]|uniref:DUF3719 domain-containing protein n=1 Tax=Soboliphyme baturini TaxID=241478 RepID=A0A183IK63_9BILA|nr:unnamed protein product [Soboliphyme baturini]